MLSKPRPAPYIINQALMTFLTHLELESGDERRVIEPGLGLGQGPPQDVEAVGLEPFVEGHVVEEPHVEAGREQLLSSMVEKDLMLNVGKGEVPF